MESQVLAGKGKKRITIVALAVFAILLAAYVFLTIVLPRQGITLIGPMFRTDQGLMIVGGVWTPDTTHGQLALKHFVFSDIECDIEKNTCLEYRLTLISRKNEEFLEEEFEYTIQASSRNEIIAFHQGTTTNRELLSLFEKKKFIS